MSKTILCADDSATMQMVAEITFRATEYEYVGAKSADEALAKARSTKPVLILADAAMPGKDGYDLCEAIKSDPALAGVPVVLMCGKSQAYDTQRGGQVGADDHVTKPWDTQVLIDKVAEILAKAGSTGVATAAKAPAVAAVPSPVDAPKPIAPVVPPSLSNPARSATIMGMPSIKPPMPTKAPAVPGVTAVQPPAIVRPPEPAKPVAAPIAAPAPKPVAPVVPKPVAAPAAAPVVARPAAPAPVAGNGTAAQAGIDRPPMIKGIPTKRLKMVSPAVVQKVTAAATSVAREAGLDPAGPEMEAILRLSTDVVERIAWEVVPELAEAILRENISALSAKQ